MLWSSCRCHSCLSLLSLIICLPGVHVARTLSTVVRASFLSHLLRHAFQTTAIPHTHSAIDKTLAAGRARCIRRVTRSGFCVASDYPMHFDPYILPYHTIPRLPCLPPTLLYPTCLSTGLYCLRLLCRIVIANLQPRGPGRCPQSCSLYLVHPDDEGVVGGRRTGRLQLGSVLRSG